MQNQKITTTIITFVAFFYNSLLTYCCLDIVLKTRQGFQELGIQTQLPWFLLVPPIFAVGSLVYWFYLKRREKKGKEAKFALLISIILLLIPGCIMPSIVALYSITPTYNFLESLR